MWVDLVNIPLNFGFLIMVSATYGKGVLSCIGIAIVDWQRLLCAFRHMLQIAEKTFNTCRHYLDIDSIMLYLKDKRGGKEKKYLINSVVPAPLLTLVYSLSPAH